MHHGNWRQRAVTISHLTSVENVQYTAVVSMSETDFTMVRKLLLDFIDRKRSIVAHSQEEDLFGVCVDLFRA